MDTARPFDLLSRILSQTSKEAFTPSPGVQEAVMSGGAPQGGPPGAPPGAGPTPGGDPAAMGPPPGGDPGAPPPPDAAPGPSPVEAKLDQLIQLMTQQQQQGGAGGGAAGGGAGGKPNVASVKFEPQHIQQMAHDISVIAAINRQMADQLGLEVPASSLFNVGMMGAPVPGTPAAAGAAGGAPQQPGGPAPGQPAGGGAPPSSIAQQLPGLPPVAGKSAAANVDPVAEAIRIGNILKAGTAVSAAESELPSRGYALASIVAAARSRKGQ